MNKTLELFLSLLVTVIFMVLVPLIINKTYMDISKRNQTEYEMERIAWELETEKTAPMYELKEMYVFDAYNKYHAHIPVTSEKHGATTYIVVPEGTKYLSFTYGKNTKWIVFPD